MCSTEGGPDIKERHGTDAARPDSLDPPPGSDEPGPMGSILRAMAEAPSVPVGAPLRQGQVVGGNFEIMQQLARGGMGVVYLARDLELERDVALKVHLAHDHRGGLKRLQHEAKAMARLAHPNVVTVFDVGELDQQRLYMVMEYVDGETARQWLSREQHTPRQKLELLLHAGRGLAAAHAAGVVHLDFKPENILIGKDGRVRVADFGLAQPAALDLSGDGDLPSVPDGLPPWTGRHHALGPAGTPAYMAPEQFTEQQQEVDARADQYAFGVVLHEALYGSRPVEGDTIVEITDRLLLDQRVEPPSQRGVPRWMRLLLRRALAPNPAERFGTMEELLDRLQRGLNRRRWQRWAVALGVLLLVAVGSWLATRPEPCSGGAQYLKEVWDEGRRAQLRQAMLALNSAHAADTFQRTAQLLDAYATSWIAGHRAACRATHVERVQSAELLDRRMACLTRRRGALEALVQVLLKADGAVLNKAIQAAGKLPRLQSCADSAYLLAQLKPPTDAGVRQRVRALRAALARARALSAAGRYEPALAVAQEAATGAGKVGYAPLVAEARFRVGSLQARAGKYKESEASLGSAYFQARRLGHDHLAVAAACRLTYVTGYHMTRHREALTWSRHSLAEARRIRPGGVLEAHALGNRGVVLDEMGRYDAALRHHQQSLAMLQKVRGPRHIEVAEALSRVGSVLEAMGRRSEAIPLGQRSLALYEQILGLQHPELRPVLGNLGLSLSALGRHDQAIVYQQRAVRIARRSFGTTHSYVGFSLLNLGVAYQYARRLPLAAGAYRQALAVVSKAMGPRHPDTALCLTNLGLTLADQGQHLKAAALHRRALQIYNQAMGPKHPKVALCLTNLGCALVEQGKAAEALPHLRRAVAIWDRSSPRGSDVSFALTTLGQALRLLGKPAEALAPLRRALKLRLRHRIEAWYIAETRYELAQALVASGTRGGRAVSEGRMALELYRGLGQRGARKAAAVRAWLQAKGGPRP